MNEFQPEKMVKEPKLCMRTNEINRQFLNGQKTPFDGTHKKDKINVSIQQQSGCDSKQKTDKFFKNDKGFYREQSRYLIFILDMFWFCLNVVKSYSFCSNRAKLFFLCVSKVSKVFGDSHIICK